MMPRKLTGTYSNGVDRFESIYYVGENLLFNRVGNLLVSQFSHFDFVINFKQTLISDFT